MLLQRLREHEVNNPTPEEMPFMYTPTPIRWLIDLDIKGGFHGFVLLEGEGKAGARGREMPAPNVMRSSGIKPRLLADRAEYVLGEVVLADSNDEKRKIAREKHQAFLRLLEQCWEETRETSLKAVLDFMQSSYILSMPKELSPGDNITFQVDNVLPIELPSVRAFWANRFKSDAPQTAQCLVCGQACSPIERWDIKIKGIPGGQSSGTALVSANANAFESYGLEASKIAPTCRLCAEQVGKALNRLIRSETNTLVLGKTRYVFWTRQQTGFSVAPILREPNAEEVARLLRSYRTGSAASANIDDLSAFYAIALTGSGGRVAVKDWIETTVGKAQHNLARWFRLQRLVDWDGQVMDPYGLFPIAASIAPKTKGAPDIPANISRSMMAAALTGAAFTPYLLYQAVRRNQAEQGITRPRAVLIKMALLSQNLFDLKEDDMIELEQTNREPAYLCGRLLAELENIQKEAVPGAKATLVDRFFGTASSAPASVFGNLMRGAQPHLSKLRKEKPKIYAATQTRLEEIQEALPFFPKVLTMQEQGLFSLGYYHQRAAIAAIKRSKINEKNDVGESKKEA